MSIIGEDANLQDLAPLVMYFLEQIDCYSILQVRHETTFYFQRTRIQNLSQFHEIALAPLHPHNFHAPFFLPFLLFFQHALLPFLFLELYHYVLQHAVLSLLILVGICARPSLVHYSVQDFDPLFISCTYIHLNLHVGVDLRNTDRLR